MMLMNKETMMTIYPANPKILSSSFNVTNANSSTSERLNANLMSDLEHRRSILSHHQLSDPTPVSLHFNKRGHSINGIRIIPLELKRSNREGSEQRLEQAHSGKTLSPLGITRRGEAR